MCMPGERGIRRGCWIGCRVRQGDVARRRRRYEGNGHAGIPGVAARRREWLSQYMEARLGGELSKTSSAKEWLMCGVQCITHLRLRRTLSGVAGCVRLLTGVLATRSASSLSLAGIRKDRDCPSQVQIKRDQMCSITVILALLNWRMLGYYLFAFCSRDWPPKKDPLSSLFRGCYIMQHPEGAFDAVGRAATAPVEEICSSHAMEEFLGKTLCSGHHARALLFILCQDWRYSTGRRLEIMRTLGSWVGR
jgi:hypothetical protein